MSESIRAFIAVDINPKIKAEIGKIQDQLKQANADIKWVRPENIHITMKFLGNIGPDRIATVQAVLGRTLSGSKPFDCRVSGLGAFPHPDRPRILWIGLEDRQQRLKGISERMEDELVKEGFQKEDKPFSPHMTIGRSRSSRNLRELSKSLSGQIRPPELIQHVSKITLFKSILGAEGPTYVPLSETELH